MNVYHGYTAAGATWPPPWRALSKERPFLRDELKVIWRTDPLPNNGLVVRKDIPDALVQKVAMLLFNLHKHETGQKILARMELSRFEPATADTYQPVIQFLTNYNNQVAPIQIK